MRILIVRLEHYLDTSIWFAVKPIDPMLDMFFISESPQSYMVGAFNDILDRRFRMIRDKLGIPDEEPLHWKEPDSQEFMSYLTPEEQNMRPDDRKPPSA